MQVRFWGTRGSLPKPGPTTLRYGGNTSCLEVRTRSGTLIIIDCGSGLHELGQALKNTTDTGGHILISHTHWDHIQGIPFFAPFFDPAHHWHIYAPRGFGPTVQETLAGQMQYSYFPLRLDQLAAQIYFHELSEGVFEVEAVRIRTCFMNHTALTLGFRVEADGATFVYASDHEPFAREIATGHGPMTGRDLRHCRFIEGADLVIHDAQFTADEYSDRAGWGHSTIEYAVAVASAAKARRLALTHHDPLRTDSEIDELVAATRRRAAGLLQSLEIFAAAEGQTIEFADDRQKNPVQENKSEEDISAVVERVLINATRDLQARSILKEAAEADDLETLDADTAEAAIAQAGLSHSPILVADLDDLCSAFSEAPDKSLRMLPMLSATILIADSDADVHAAERLGLLADDYLIKPFSVSYARTILRAARLRTTRRWQRAPTPANEQTRLKTLSELAILDTPSEERFDRITRLAASLFATQTALISLVDRDRQWFKSAHGLSATETSRETSFCAHAVATGAPLVVRDTFLDPRFADNPLVTGAPHIRFYAGVPLFVGSACVGTVCILDNKPREFPDQSMQVLKDLAAMAEAEVARTR